MALHVQGAALCALVCLTIIAEKGDSHAKEISKKFGLRLADDISSNNKTSNHFNRTMGDPVLFFRVPEASDITWAHAVNSESLLTAALANATIMMLEADVSLQGQDGKTPWMAHSAEEKSDITLDEWLRRVLAGGTKGIKLDFKTIQVALAAVDVLRKHENNIAVPFWLNADIVSPGPANSTAVAVAAADFLEKVGAKFSQSTLSIGWTTNCPADLCGTAEYTWENVFAMMEAIERSTSAVTTLQPVTFPVRAAFVTRSVRQLRWLLDVLETRGSSLTIWTNIADVNYTSVDALLQFRKHFGADVVYYDLLDSQKTQFELKKSFFLPGSNVTEPKARLKNILEPYHSEEPSGVPSEEPSEVPSEVPSDRDAFLVGSQTLLLRSGQGFRTTADYHANSTSRFQLKSTFYFGRNSNPMASVSVILRPGSSGGNFVFIVQKSGKLELRNCLNDAKNCSSSTTTSQMATPLWAKNIGNFSGLFTLTASDDVVLNKATFTVWTENNLPIVHEHNFETTSKLSTNFRNSPQVRCDFLPADAFVVVENVAVEITNVQSSASVGAVPFGLGMLLLAAVLPWM